MEAPRHLPDSSRLSVLTASVLLAFSLTHVLQIPESFRLAIDLWNFHLAIPLNLGTLIILLAAGMTAPGIDWLLNTHPSLQPGETREHWLLPALTVLVSGLALSTLPANRIWWLGFAFSALLFVVVSVSEYIAVDSRDVRYPVATAILTILAFIIFLLLAVALKTASARLVMVVPALFLGSGLASLRTLHLRLNERWEPAWAAGIGLIVAQLGAALHYLPLNPLRFGLILLALLYALTALSASLAAGHPLRKSWLEPGIMFLIFLGLAAWFR